MRARVTREKTRSGWRAAGHPVAAAPSVRGFRLVVAEGPDGGRTWESVGDRAAVGTEAPNDLRLSDETASRFHCEVRIEASGAARVRDLGSANGTLLDGVQVVEAFLRDGSQLRLGGTLLRFELLDAQRPLPVSERTTFGSLHGVSAPMRSAFAVLERAARTDVAVLLEGESGTGKSQAARSIHRESARAGGPFVALDCSAVPANLLESELFGHEKGAFTGAVARRTGAFEEASGGTLFLDEIGELGVDLQPKLLAALENRAVCRVGGHLVPVDVRVVAATNRDVRAEVNAGRFHADLYLRLAVVKISLPPLRQRPDDLPALVTELLAQMGAEEAGKRLVSEAFLAALVQAAWPGNVRELRNYLERCVVFQEAMPLGDDVRAAAREGRVMPVDPAVPYALGRDRAMGEWERRYLEALLERHGGRMLRAAEAAGIGRVYLYKLLRKHGLPKRDARQARSTRRGRDT